jgi:hypothetical protein
MTTTDIGGSADAAMADVVTPSASLSRDLARSQGTDFFAMDDLLSDEERSVRDRVRAFADDELIPVANQYWERAEFPAPLLPAYARLGVAGGAIQGYDCPGMSPVAEGLVALELARGDGSFSTFNSVHSGLVMATCSARRSRSSAGCPPWPAVTSSAPSPSPSPTTAPTSSGWPPGRAATGITGC